jgi:NTP pyrophosphatase (non-canonical NTP hydrolase)
METKNKKETDLEIKINNYVDWFFEECGEPRDELRYIIKLILESGEFAQEHLLDVLKYYAIKY